MKSAAQPANAAPDFCRADRLPFRRLDHQTLIVNPQSREVHVLNGTGSRLWELLEQPRTVAQLIADFTAADDIDANPADIARDIEGFVGELLAKGLIVENRSAAGAQR